MSDELPLRQRKLEYAGGTTRPAFVTSGAAYGRLHGVTKAAVSKWNKEGLVVFVEDDEKPGKQLIDVAASDAKRGLAQNPLKRLAAAPAPATTSASETAPDTESQDLLARAHSPIAAAAAPEPSAGTPTGAGAAEPTEDPDATADKPIADPIQARANLEKLRALELANQDKELRLRERMGELTRRDSAEQLVFTTLRRVRDTILSAPIDCCEAANPDDPRRAEAAFRAELEKKLTRAAIQVEMAISGEELAADAFEDDDQPEAASTPAAEQTPDQEGEPA